jgi:hypothetical protein
MTWEERLIWVAWISIMFLAFGVIGALLHYGNFLVYTIGRNYLLRGDYHIW